MWEFPSVAHPSTCYWHHSSVLFSPLVDRKRFQVAFVAANCAPPAAGKQLGSGFGWKLPCFCATGIIERFYLMPTVTGCSNAEVGWMWGSWERGGVKCEVIFYLLLHPPFLPLPLAQTNKHTKEHWQPRVSGLRRRKCEDGEETVTSASIRKQKSEAKVFVKHLYQRISACSSVLW